MALKQCYFYLRGHTQFLGYLGLCVPFQRSVLLSGGFCFCNSLWTANVLLHACCLCTLAVYAFLDLCMHACFVYRLAAHTSLLCMHGYCVCANAMYAQLLCVHTCMLEVVYACLRVRNSRTHSLVPCGVGEEHWAGLYIHQEGVYASQMWMLHSVARPHFGDCLHKTLDPFWFN